MKELLTVNDVRLGKGNKPTNEQLTEINRIMREYPGVSYGEAIDTVCEPNLPREPIDVAMSAVWYLAVGCLVAIAAILFVTNLPSDAGSRNAICLGFIIPLAIVAIGVIAQTCKNRRSLP